MLDLEHRSTLQANSGKDKDLRVEFLVEKKICDMKYGLDKEEEGIMYRHWY